MHGRRTIVVVAVAAVGLVMSVFVLPSSSSSSMDGGGWVLAENSILFSSGCLSLSANEMEAVPVV